MDDTIESLKLEVSYSDKDKATSKVNNLVNALKKLQKQGSDTSGINKAYNALSKFSKLSFQKQVNQLEKIANICKAIKLPTNKDVKNKLDFAESLKNNTIPNIEYTDVTTQLPDVEPLKAREITGVEEINQGLEDMSSNSEKVNSQIDKTQRLFETSRVRVDILTNKLKNLGNLVKDVGKIHPKDDNVKLAKDFQINKPKELDEITDTISKLNEEFFKLTGEEKSINIKELETLYQNLSRAVIGLRSMDSQIDKTERSLEKLDNKTSRMATGSLKKFAGSLARIAGYRAIRTMISSITNALKDGITNVSMFNKEVAESVRQIKGVGGYLTNSLGALAAPIITALTPAIELLAKGVVVLLNSFNQLFSTLSGKSTFIKAKDDIDAYTRALQLAKSSASGFDELNVINQDSTSYADMFETVPIQNDAIDNTKLTLASILSIMASIAAKTGAWKLIFGKVALVVGAVLAIIKSFTQAYKNSEKLRNGIKKLGEVGMKLFEALNEIIDTVIGVVLELLDSLQPLIDVLLEAIVDILIDLAPLITKILNLIVRLVNVLMPLVKWIIDWLMPTIEGVVKLIWSILEPVIEYIISAVDTVIKVVEGLMKVIKGIFEGDFSMVMDGIKQMFMAQLESIKNFFVGVWELLKGLGEGLGEYFKGVGETLSEFWGTVWEKLKQLFSSMSEGVSKFLAPIGEWFKNLGNSIVGFFGNAWSTIKNGASNAWNGVTSVFSKVGDFFKDVFGNAWEGVLKIFNKTGQVFTDIKDAIVGAFKKVINGLLQGINNVISKPFEGINDIFEGIQSISIFGLKPFGWIPTIPVPQIPLLADGGFVNSGQLFIANEAGAELVGNIGGRTGVANNEQIITGIKQGVYEAMLEANQNGNDNPYEIKVYLDSKEIAARIQAIKKDNSANIYKGGVLDVNY